MTIANDSTASSNPAASRRHFVTAATAMAAASAAAATGSAQAQAGVNVRHSNPSGMTQPTAYSQVVEVNGPHRGPPWGAAGGPRARATVQRGGVDRRRQW
jgi:hypothetical protein